MTATNRFRRSHFYSMAYISRSGHVAQDLPGMGRRLGFPPTLWSVPAAQRLRRRMWIGSASVPSTCDSSIRRTASQFRPSGCPFICRTQECDAGVRAPRRRHQAGQSESEPHFQIVAGSGIPVFRRTMLFLQLQHPVGCYASSAGKSPHPSCVQHSSAQSRELGQSGKVCFRVAGQVNCAKVGQISQTGLKHAKAVISVISSTRNVSHRPRGPIFSQVRIADAIKP